ncbi:uncharacterized protein LOC134677023 isoform X2 [Cydia fagiglandana]|uniref:uncharacterized protein LOC134677023 isoform X2 n=1 Tax=Cydia fagiglandana TaxID=1458189 RepID=UPI002FEE03E4
MPRCVIINCNSPAIANTQRQGHISYHSFPHDPVIKEKWIAATGRKDWFPTKHSTICSIHFDNTSFIEGKKLRLLKKTAYPTVNILKLIENDEVNTDDTEISEPGPSKRSRRDSNSSTDSDSNDEIIEQCRFCAKYSKDCMDTCYVPFLMENKASIVFNDNYVNLDFTDNNLPKTVCRDCTRKLQDIISFITQVTEAQKKFKVVAKNNRKVYEFKDETIKKKQTIKKNRQTSKKLDSTRDTIEKETITNDDDDEDTRDAFENTDIKIEYESPTDEGNIRDIHKIKIEQEPEDNTEITDSLLVEQPVFFRGYKRKNEDAAVTKKAKFICEEEVTFEMDVKEEVTNDANEDYPEVEVEYDSGTATTGIGTAGTVSTENVTPGTITTGIGTTGTVTTEKVIPGTITTRIGTIGTVTTEKVIPGTITTGIGTTGTDSSGIGAFSALASVKYITIDGSTGRFCVKSGNKGNETE